MRRFTVTVETDTEDAVPVITDHARRLTEELAASGDGSVYTDVHEDEDGTQNLIESWHSEVEVEESGS